MTPGEIPQQLGNYKLLRQIGRGGFATVYLARHIHLNNYVAVKILHTPFGTIDRIDQFRREAQTIAELTHPNIVRVLDFDVYDEYAFFVMEYAPYGSLRKQYKLGTLVPLPAVLSYVNQIAGALHYAHQHRVIHRDVKPENMLIGKDSRILLSDFGIAALLASSRMQTTGETAGTIAYIAPEQIQGKARPASDQYALAVSAYEWLCGESPFTGTMTEVIAKHLSTEPPRPRTYAPDLPYDVEYVLLKALAKDPTQRFSSIPGFAKALSKAAGVTPRAPEDEQFTAITRAGQATSSMKAVSSEKRSSRRDVASVPTIRQAEQLSGAPRPVQHKLSRRAILFGTVALVGAGSIGVTMAALRQAPAAPAHLQSSVVSQPSQGSTPTPLPPTATPTRKPMPDPTATATPVPNQPVSQQPPTQPPAPTPTPTPLVPTGQLYATYHGHTSVVFSVAWSPDGTRIASGGGDRTAQIWHASDGGQIVKYARHTAAVTFVAWSPDGQRIASSSDDKTVQVWDAISGNTLFTCVGHSSSVHSTAWSPDGTRIASGSTDRSVRVWDAATGSPLLTYREHAATVWGVAWSPDGKYIVSSSTDHTAKVWNVATGVTTTSYTSTDIVGYVAWSPDGKYIATGGNNMNVEIWNAATGSLLTSYLGHTGIVYGVCWSPDGRLIASGSADTTVTIIDPMLGVGRFTYRGHSSYVFGVAWSPDGTRIVSGSDDKTVQVWF